MEQTKSSETPNTSEATDVENCKPALTLEILIERMMQSRRDIDAYRRGEMSQAEFDALGIKFF